MKLYLKRHDYREDGIFGELVTELGKQIAVTVEHSYDRIPKLPNGNYTCKRGVHKLSGQAESFETFEIKDVPGHKGILFHVGNYGQKDSSGCVLLGTGLGNMSNGGKMIVNSKKAFSEFMLFTSGVVEFELVVEDFYERPQPTTLV